jgi:hypothetical protein
MDKKEDKKEKTTLIVHDVIHKTQNVTENKEVKNGKISK